ncbi:hypothetical protein V6Z11_A03G048000 [Gossypium hirsutum]
MKKKKRSQNLPTKNQALISQYQNKRTQLTSKLDITEMASQESFNYPLHQIKRRRSSFKKGSLSVSLSLSQKREPKRRSITKKLVSCKNPPWKCEEKLKS